MTIDRVTGPLTVGQLAARAGVRADTIRYYERSGLLPEPNRTDGDHRRYGPADLDRMLFIRGAQRLGLRLAEIRELLVVRETGAAPAVRPRRCLREHIGELNQEIARLTALRAELSGMVAGLSGPSGSVPGPRSGHLVRDRSPATESNAGGGDRNVLVLR